MADPVLDNQIILWQPDAATTDTNLPQGSSLMTPGGPTELAGELRVIKSVTREVSVDLAWERWAGLYGTLTFVDATHFTLSGDQRTIFQGTTNPANPGPVEIGRRIRATVAAGSVYGTISNATFSGGVTNVTLVMDSNPLDPSLSEVAFGTDTLGNSSLPSGVAPSAPLYGIATGTNTYAVAISISAYQTGQEYRILFTNANTGPSTININGLGAVAIVKAGSVSLTAGDLTAGAVYELVYDGTNMQLIGASTSAGASVIPMGTSGSGATPIGVASIQVGSVGTPANTSQVTLFSYTLPADALITNGQGVRLTTWWTFAAPVRGKTIRVFFGATQIYSHGDSQPEQGQAFGVVIRTGAATQAARMGSGTLIDTDITSPTADLTTPVLIKVTGQNSVAAANDVICFGLLVEYLS